MTVNEIRSAYLNYFAAKPRNHAIIPAAPIVPLNDPTTLFSSSGMQQLVPFLKGEPHPMGKRLADSQPSIRVEDIEEIGDNRHTTFFEMLGNWSLGDYFKKEQLPWVYDFLTQELGLDPQRLYVTVFAGNNTVPKDEESVNIWQDLFRTASPAKPGREGFDPSVKIYTYDAKKNWWSRAGVPDNMPPGEIGGPDSEIFFDFGAERKLHEQSAFANEPCHVNCDCGRFLEIGNSVFMEYLKEADGSFTPLPHQNVDFGGGLERIAAAVNDDPDVFTIDVFQPLISAVAAASNKAYEGQFQAPMRIIADHLRAAVFIINAGITPGNKLQGYTLRRLLRRATLKARQLEIVEIPSLFSLASQHIIDTYQATYFSKGDNAAIIETVILEVNKFEKALVRGLKEFEKREEMSGKDAFDLLQTYGFPWELSLELAQEKGMSVNREEFVKEFKKHQELSRTASKGLFKGGLAGNSEAIIKYHTTTHLLHQALRQILGNHVQQMGSNITTDRLRFDFKHSVKLTDEEKRAIEQLVNEKITENLPVHKTIENKEQALQSGAMAFFREKYPDQVSVYTIGSDPVNHWFSKELCGGPHVTSTGQIGPVTIKKEEAVGAGVRRIYMVLSPQN